jgi:hypothetical protein
VCTGHDCVFPSDLRRMSCDLHAVFTDRSVRRVVGYATACRDKDGDDSDARRHPTPYHAECGVFAKARSIRYSPIVV